jgi:dUTP pyrophosphatase
MPNTTTYTTVHSTDNDDDVIDSVQQREEIREDMRHTFMETHQLLKMFGTALLDIKFKRIGASDFMAVMPVVATPGSAGADLYSAESLTIQPGETVLVHTGWSIELPSPFLAVYILPRSGLAKNEKRVTVANSPGLIDYDYRGEVIVMLHNRNVTPFTINVGDRIAQMMIVPNLTPFFRFEETTDDLSATERGTGGLGSTGIK